MKIIKFDKLIRDNIPEIMTNAGKSFIVEEMDDKKYLLKLKEKLIEEAKEVNEASGDEIIGELADVMEIISAIENVYSINHNLVIEKQSAKAKSNGRFEKKLLLKEVYEND